MTVALDITHESTWLKLEAPYDEALVAQVKAIPGARFNIDAEGNRSWVVPEEAIGSIEAIGKLGIAKVTWRSPKPSRAFAQTIVNTDPVWNDTLRPYQRDGADFLSALTDRHGAALLADDPGLGKTAQVLAFSTLVPESDALLVIAPAVVLGQWHKECFKWRSTLTPEDVAVVRKPKQLQKMLASDDSLPLITIASYDFVRANRDHWIDYLEASPVDGIVLDEIHYIASAKAKRSKAIRSLLDHHSEHGWVIGLSGTPMLTRPRDLWHVLDTLFPSRFGNFIPFAKRYCDGHQEEVAKDKTVWITDGSSNEQELHERLSWLMLRRSKVDVLDDLPAKNRILIPIEPDRDAKRALIHGAAASPLAQRALEELLGVTEHSKIAPAVELVDDLRSNGARVLVFTTLKAVAKRIATELGCSHVTGDDDAEDRKSILVESCKRASAGVATIYSVTTGIDLVEFDTAVFVGLDWVPSNLIQAEGRLHRIGQKTSVNIYYLIVSGTVDEAIRIAVVDRLGAFGAILGNATDQEGLRGSLDESTSVIDLINAAVRELDSHE